MTYDIKNWRFKLGITQEKAAELLGVHRVSYINWETNKVPVSKSVELACQNLALPNQPSDSLIKQIDDYKTAYKIYFQAEPIGEHLIYTPWKSIKYKLIDLTPCNSSLATTHQN